MNNLIRAVLTAISGVLLVVPSATLAAQAKPRIAVVSGPVATIQNSEPLVTSNKARSKYGLTPLADEGGAPLKYDHLAPQRLAAPVEVLIEQFSGHPLERDAAELYGPPDGYVDAAGNFNTERQGAADKAVYKVTLDPDDGLYMLPYMARQVDGRAWDGDCARPWAPANQCRQPFFPDGARIFEEIDRGIWGVSERGLGNMLASKAEFDFYRGVPAGGYKRGLSAAMRTDVGDGDILPETMGEDFFVYKPVHLRTSTRYLELAKAANSVQNAVNAADYLGLIWLEGSPTVEETIYWLNLMVDTRVPIVANAAQRPNRSLSADGPRNIVDSVDYIVSRVWSDAQGNNELGAVMVQDEQIFAARQVQKSDARPGGYVAAGGHGGILGTMGVPGRVHIYFKPHTRHTWRSEVRLTVLPDNVTGVERRRGKLRTLEIRTRDAQGELIAEAIPRVTIIKAGTYHEDAATPSAATEVGILAHIKKNLDSSPLAGFVGEGLAPYGFLPRSPEIALERAAFSGMPTVYVGRGNAGGLAASYPNNLSVEGNNLTATKARYLLTACLLKFGSLPPAKDPENPTPDERKAVVAKLAQYQAIFDTH